MLPDHSIRTAARRSDAKGFSATLQTTLDCAPPLDLTPGFTFKDTEEENASLLRLNPETCERNLGAQTREFNLDFGCSDAVRPGLRRSLISYLEEAASEDWRGSTADSNSDTNSDANSDTYSSCASSGRGSPCQPPPLLIALTRSVSSSSEGEYQRSPASPRRTIQRGIMPAAPRRRSVFMPLKRAYPEGPRSHSYDPERPPRRAHLMKRLHLAESMPQPAETPMGVRYVRPCFPAADHGRLQVAFKSARKKLVLSAVGPARDFKPLQ